MAVEAPKQKAIAEDSPKGHLLAAAMRVWAQMKDEFEPAAASAEAADVAAAQGGGGGYDAGAQPPTALAQEEPLVSAEELKKLTKLLQHVVTKFGASASVADEKDVEGLKPIAAEVIQAYTAALGTLLSLKRGAGASLLAELRGVGSGLAVAVDALGAAVGTPSLALNAGKVLTCAKLFEKVSTTGRASVRRRLLRSLAQLRDAKREVSQALAEADADADEDEDDLGDFDDMGGGGLEPEERCVFEALAAVCGHLEATLQEASKACAAGRPLALLEATATHAAAATDAVDALAAGASDGLEVAVCQQGLERLCTARDGLRCAAGDSASDEDPIAPALLALRQAIDAAAAAESEDD